MARGGRRPGAGRKKGSKSFGKAVVLGLNGRRLDTNLALPAGPTDPAPDPDGLSTPPEGFGLGPDDQTVWRNLAPHALKERTLSPSRVPGFVTLCQQWAYCAAMRTRVGELGVTSADADRLLKRLETWQKLLKASLGEFNLRSFGKPVTVEKPKAVTNPFATVSGR